MIDPDAARTGAGPGVGGPGARPPGRIVVGVDGSDCSVQALRSAARHAELTGATIDAAAGAEMLVVGSRGHGAVVGMLRGSVSEDVFSHAPCPVLVMRHPGAVEPGRARPLPVSTVVHQPI